MEVRQGWGRRGAPAAHHRWAWALPAALAPCRECARCPRAPRPAVDPGPPVSGEIQYPELTPDTELKCQPRWDDPDDPDCDAGSGEQAAPASGCRGCGAAAVLETKHGAVALHHSPSC